MSEVMFPALLKNTKECVLVVGGLRFPPLGVLSVDKLSYERNKELIELCLSVGNLVDLNVVNADRCDECIDECEGGCIKEKHAEEFTGAPDEDIMDEPVMSKSVVRRYHDKELSWQQTLKELDSITDKDTLEELYNEALVLGIKPDGVVMNSLRSMLMDVDED